MKITLLLRQIWDLPQSPLLHLTERLCVEKGVHNIILSIKLYACTSKVSLSQVVFVLYHTESYAQNL